MFYMRAYMFRNVPRVIRRRTADAEPAGERQVVHSLDDLARPVAVPTSNTSVGTRIVNIKEYWMSKSVMGLTAWLLLSTSSYIPHGEAQTFDWDQWRHMPVQEGGRHKPLGTLAWESLRTIANKASFTDPETGQQLDATTLYLVMLFDWKGWDRPVNFETFAGRHSRASYFSLHEPDKWDRASLLRVDFLAVQRWVCRKTGSTSHRSTSAALRCRA